MTVPGWWADGVEVRNLQGALGVLRRMREGWMVQVGDASLYLDQEEAGKWWPDVRQLLNRGQLNRIAHDAERAVLRTFGCHYVPEWEALPDSVRAINPRPRAVNRPELNGLLTLIRGAVLEALSPYTTES